MIAQKVQAKKEPQLLAVNRNWKKWAVRCSIVFLLLLLAVAGIYRLNDFTKESLISTAGHAYEKAKVVSIIKDNLAEDGQRYGDQEVELKLASGEYKGKTVSATSPSGTLFGADCVAGMKVIAIVSANGDNIVATVFSQDRTIPIAVFAGLFMLTVCLIGGVKGIKALCSLILTFVLLIWVMFPLVYKGFSPIIGAILVSLLSTLITLLMLGGICKKTISAIAGTTIGVAVAGVAALLFGKGAGISGYNVSDIETLNYVAQYCKIHVGELLFAGIIISALGAVMDVGMSISSTIQEIHDTDPTLGRKQLFIAGIHVGKDMMGTMVNTLILAFVGGSLSTLLINYAYDLPLNQFMNSYNMGIEIMQGIAGSFGVVLTVPVTAFVAAWFIGGREKHLA